MRLSPSFTLIMSIAINECYLTQRKEIEPEHILMALLKFSEFTEKTFQIITNEPKFRAVLAHDLNPIKSFFSSRNLETTVVRRKIRSLMGIGSDFVKGKVVHRSILTKKLFGIGFQISVEEKNDCLGPVHLLYALLAFPTDLLRSVEELKLEGPQQLTSKKSSQKPEPDILEPQIDDASKLGRLTTVLRDLRNKLNTIIIGQEHAINSFIDGLFSAEAFASVETDRHSPKGIFVFAGPPGVGKTFLAEKVAEQLKRPFRRFDMSGYSGHDESFSLVGAHKSYKDAHPGMLTDFVRNNPNAILLFDEIEKAHLNTIQYFLQILDAGRLEDKFYESSVDFSHVIVIFTTNAGKTLYEDPNRTGVQTTNALWHRKTILDALESEIDHRTGKPFFPAAICSRMAAGYPVMFNKLGVAELEKIGQIALHRMSVIVEKAIGKKLSIGPLVPLCLLLREGVQTDARMLTSQIELFVKEEIFRFSLLFRQERLNKIMEECDQIYIDVDKTFALSENVNDVFQGKENPEVLVLTEDYLADMWKEKLQGVNITWSNDLHDIIHILTSKQIDVVLLDLWVGQNVISQKNELSNRTVYQFDYVPGGATDIAHGQEILRSIRAKFPDIPCLLLSFKEKDRDQATVDDELFLACNKSGGARGIIETSFLSTDMDGWKEESQILQEKIMEYSQRLWRERCVEQLGKERKTLFFKTVPEVSDKTIRIRLRDLRFEQTLLATDINAILQDFERPSVKFSDVYGADVAKTELDYIVRWLKNPRDYIGRGLKNPRGILLYGYPGTGKTMLARALAGESNVAFLQTSATGFVTKWQGSGPENVRKLFEQARRYAPAIIFIDEIDSIGKRREGARGGSDSAAEQTLNALLVEMDGFSTNKTNPVIVVAATNLVGLLDDALRRRFDREIEVDRPDRDARSAYLKKRLLVKEQGGITEITIERIAGQSAGMTIAELERIIELSGRMAVDSETIINDSILEEAFERIRMGDAKITKNEEALKRIARHEAGHCLAGWLRGECPVQVTIVGRGNAGGYVERQSDEEKILYTKTELEDLIFQAMAGRAAEIIYYGDEQGLSSGAGADLRNATRYANRMVSEYGMSSEIGQVVIEHSQGADSGLSIEITHAVRKIIENQLERGIKELQSNKDPLDLLVSSLLAKNRLTTSELEKILPESITTPTSIIQ
jgi:cell division protease FtsH